MIHKIFSIHDSKAAAYLPPFIMHKTEMAIRVFSDCVNDQGHQFGKNPADYTLFEIGIFDDNKAKIESQTPKISLVNGVEVISPDNTQERLFTDPPVGDLKEVN